MTNDEFNQKFDTLTEELFFEVGAEARRLFKCGAVDVKAFGNANTLPRLLLHVALLNLADREKPTDKKSVREISNLRKF